MFQPSPLPSQLCFYATIGACMQLETTQLSSLQKNRAEQLISASAPLLQVPRDLTSCAGTAGSRSPRSLFCRGPQHEGRHAAHGSPAHRNSRNGNVEAQVEGHTISPTSLGGKGMGTGTGWANSHSTRCSWAPAAARETPSQTVTCTWLAEKVTHRKLPASLRVFVIDVAFQKHYKAAQLILPWLSPNGCMQQRQQHSEVLGALQSQPTQRAPASSTSPTRPWIGLNRRLSWIPRWAKSLLLLPECVLKLFLQASWKK